MRRARVAGLLLLGVAAVAGGAVGYGKLFPREDLPAEFAGLVNPAGGDAAAVQLGAELFRDNCASCHGDNADGKGPGAQGLEPPPANFHGSDVLVRHSDAYLYYRLTKGKPGTAMPSFDGALDPADRWALVAYLRTIGPVDDAH